MKPAKRERLYKAISSVFETEELFESKYDPSPSNTLSVIHLFVPLSFIGTPYYMTCDEFGVIFYEANKYKCCFDVTHRIPWDRVKNFDNLLVEVTMIITNNIYRTGER